MTTAEYQKLYKKAHSKNGRITVKIMRELKKVYIEAGQLASDQVVKSTLAGLSDLTSSTWSQINKQLVTGANLISEAIESKIPIGIADSYYNFLDIDIDYIMDAVNLAGVTDITRAGLRNVGVAVNFDLLTIQATRLFQDGYTFSERVWGGLKDELPFGVNGDYQYRIKNLILTGQAQGRDVIDIADDIQQYIKKGKDYVFKEGRYGKLVPGTAQYKNRISKKIDWRNASLQESGILQGKLNPGSDGDLMNWIKTTGNPIDPKPSLNASGKSCIALQRENPHHAEDINFYNHPNCSCRKEPVLKDPDEFLQELKDWDIGDGSSLDRWYEDVYLQAQ